MVSNARSSKAAVAALCRMLDELARISDEPGKLTRTFLSPAMRRANQVVGEWMRGAGLTVREDSVGNIIGRREGASPRTKTLLLGSHLDTVRDAGRFDGALGVALPIVALAEIERRGQSLPFAVEVVAFSEEEGVRFASAYLGSKGFIGTLRASDLRVRDMNGVTVRQALEEFAGGRFSLPKSVHRSGDLIGYSEVHIEQGPVLETENLAVGVVSEIAGQTRGQLTFIGEAGHAGTTPMTLRHDALAGAAELVLCAERTARGAEGLVATVGTIRISPGAPNVIPGKVVLTLDVRHARNAVRRSAVRRLLAEAKSIARRRGLLCKWQETQNQSAVTCSPVLSALMTESVRAVQKKSRTLVSGAGHDAVILSRFTPVTMLFVRCRDGLSHHPDEYAAPADLEVALRVLIDFLERLGKNRIA
jgi:allantoate deiminase